MMVLFTSFVIFFVCTQQLSSGLVGETCYAEAGCFSQSPPWVSLTRPFPPPQGPAVILPKLYLYTRNRKERFTIPLVGSVSGFAGSDFNPKRRTAFITHGFQSDGNSTWMSDLKDTYLKAIDANVFLVDWGFGAKHYSYLQVGANTRVVGALLGRFIMQLVGLGQATRDVHLMGHSLGSHISSYAAKYVYKSAGTKIAKLTALDPAQPGFETESSSEVRLDKTDAGFVEAIHSDAKPFLPLFGFGFDKDIGNVDFYLNRGAFQPGCEDTVPVLNLTSITALSNLPLNVISKAVGCSHGRAYLVYTRAIDPDATCIYLGRRVFIPYPALYPYPECGKDNCLPMGLYTENSNLTGQFQVKTSAEDPFCPGATQGFLDRIETIMNALMEYWF